MLSEVSNTWVFPSCLESLQYWEGSERPMPAEFRHDPKKYVSYDDRKSETGSV
jgi:hypothetical protein